jgi:acyl-CoA hydrolase
MVQTLYHRLILPADANHKNTRYVGSLLRLALEAGYATAWKQVGPQANLVLRRVLNPECQRPVPIGMVIEIEGASESP